MVMNARTDAVPASAPSKSGVSGRCGRQQVPAALARLASHLGIHTSYRDNSGALRYASAETLRALLGLWNLQRDGERDLRDALREEKLRFARQPLEPVSVVWDGEKPVVTLNLPGASGGLRPDLQIELEDGSRVNLAGRLRNSRQVRLADVEGHKFRRFSIPVPRLPHGYHSLCLELGGHRSKALLISAAVQTYSERFAPSWGLFAPMYALHSQQSWGAGNLTDWGRLADWSHSLGGRVMASLPVMAAFLDKPICEPSPYSPASRLFWNDFFVDLERVPEFKECKPARRMVESQAFQAALNEFRRGRYVDYRKQQALRRKVLALLSTHFFSHVSLRHGDYHAYLERNHRAADYAQFRAVCDRSGCSWRSWEERQRHGRLEPGDYSEADRRLHAYSQWIAHEQYSALVESARKRNSLFYLDLPLGVNPDGYDVWREPLAFARGASVGAPPDMFFTKGQNWGFAPLHPRSIRAGAYGYVREFLQFQMRNASLLRMDHVMGLHRLWWVPEGAGSARDGAYVSYNSEELYAILSIESHRHKTMLVGENLGTVPPEVDKAMDRHAVRRMFVLQYAQRPDPRRPVSSPVANSVASINTHDMPAFAAHFKGIDVAMRRELGLLRQSEVACEYARRRELIVALTAFLSKRKILTEGEEGAPAVVRAALRWMARTKAGIVLVTLEDLWGETLPQNVPGTSSERQNWTRKFARSIEDILRDDELAGFFASLTRSRP